MCFRIMAEVPTKPQTRHADRIIVHKNTHKHTLEYMEVEKQIAKKVGIFHHSSFSLTSIVYQLKQLLSYTMHRTTLLLLQYPLSALFSADCQEQRFWIATILRHLLFWGNKGSKFRLGIAHSQFTCDTSSILYLWWLHSSCLPNPCHAIWHLVAHNLGRISTSLFLSGSTMTVPLWCHCGGVASFPWHRNLYPQNSTVRFTLHSNISVTWSYAFYAL